MAQRYWLMKSEPDCYSIDDLARDGRAAWDGVRNYQARNFMREMHEGDSVFFYHSNTSPPGVVGLARVCREAYPDSTAWEKGSEHTDPRSTPDKPLWDMVDVCFEEKFAHPVSLGEMRQIKELDGMLVLQKGQRLSVMPVSKEHAHVLVKRGRAR